MLCVKARRVVAQELMGAFYLGVRCGQEVCGYR